MSRKFLSKKFIDSNGVKWDSKKEYQRYTYLFATQNYSDSGIANLDKQIQFLLLPSKKYELDKRTERAVNYTCDFIYTINDILYIEDVKSDFTKKQQEYVLRRKMFKYFYLSDPNYEKLHKVLPNIKFKKAQFVEYVK